MVAAAMIGSAVIGGVTSSRAARSAANAQTQAADSAAELQREQFNQTREDMAPWRNAGVNALGYLEAGIKPGGEFMRDFTMADFEKDPGYDFRFREGLNALDRSASARGMRRSGAALKGITRYGQDFASNEYTNAFNRFRQQVGDRYNRLAGVSGTGQTTTQQIGQFGANAATNQGNAIMGAGNARASGYIGQGNAINSAISNGANMYMNYRALQPPPAGGIGYGAASTPPPGNYPY